MPYSPTQQFRANRSGRKRGSPDKVTHNAKQAIESVFNGLGGWEGMLAWAKVPENTGLFYTQIYTKLIPKDLRDNPNGNRIQVVILPPNSPSTPLHIDIDPPTSEIQVSDDAK